MLIPRGKVTGGSSAINGQVFLRGVPEDYNLWAQSGNDEWGFEDCFEYFKKLETDLDFGETERPRRQRPDLGCGASSARR